MLNYCYCDEPTVLSIILTAEFNLNERFSAQSDIYIYPFQSIYFVA